jgi:hypothetical protein
MLKMKKLMKLLFYVLLLNFIQRQILFDFLTKVNILSRALKVFVNLMREILHDKFKRKKDDLLKMGVAKF